MANPYLDQSDLLDYYDQNLVWQLVNDNKTVTPNPTRLVILMDDAASEMEVALSGAYRAPITDDGTTSGTAPRVLTRVVAAMTMKRLYQRRGDTPKGVMSEIEWAMKFVADVAARRQALPLSFRNGVAVEIAIDLDDTDENSILNRTVFYP